MRFRRFLLIAVLLGALAGPAHAASQVEPQAARWQTWVLSSSSALRPAAPPDSSATGVELAQMKALSSTRAESGTAERIGYWDAGAPTYHWVEIGLRRILQEPVKSINLQRNIALYMVAMYDATIATWDAKYAYNRGRPSQVDSAFETAVAVPSSPSYPSEHAATAAAAAAILGYLYPADAATFSALADQAGQSRVLAGVQYPSDVQAGAALGRAVAAQVIERARYDGTAQDWTGSVPVGPGLWNGTNPLFPSRDVEDLGAERA
jgi:membrane-associated phospholipid phosphatase